MQKELYLLWTTDGWGVFDETTCPDTGAFPEHWYKKYAIPPDKSDIVLKILLERRDYLASSRILPTRSNRRDIFPDVSEIL